MTANDPCAIELGSGWRIPTYTEWLNVDASGGWTNWDGPWNSGLKMHAAGYLDFSYGSLYVRGNQGYYWGSTQGDATYANMLYFYGGDCYMNIERKTSGFSVRCIREN